MKAYELLDSPEKWTKGVMAKNLFGITVDPLDSSSTCWCVSGAIKKCYDGDNEALWTVARLIKDEIKMDITFWNDNPETAYCDVIELLKKLNI